MRKKVFIALLALGVALSMVSCQKKAKVEGVDLSVTFADQPLTDNLMTNVTYAWKTSPGFKKLAQDYKVFVHFWHNNNLLVQDDYATEVPTTKWESGKEYTLTRRVYIPRFIDEFDPQFKGQENLTLAVGLYNPYDRTGKSELEVYRKKLDVIPPPVDTPEIIYEDGWYDKETNPESALKEWRWASKEAKCLIDNPRRDALLVIQGGVNLEAAPGQRVIFKINDTVLDEFAPSESSFDKTYRIKKEMLGDKDDFILTIGVDKTFVPGNSSPRRTIRGNSASRFPSFISADLKHPEKAGLPPRAGTGLFLPFGKSLREEVGTARQRIQIGGALARPTPAR